MSLLISCTSLLKTFGLSISGTVLMDCTVSSAASTLSPLSELESWLCPNSSDCRTEGEGSEEGTGCEK